MKILRIAVLPFSALIFLAACEQGADSDGRAPYSSRYAPLPSEATILTTTLPGA